MNENLAGLVPGLAVEEAGAGPVVIQAHGMSSSRDADLRLGFDFSVLAATHRLVRYDARGHGESTGRPVPEDYTWPALATDLLALVTAVGGGEPVDVIGASMGVGTVLHAALRQPFAFRRLVLLIPPTAWETRALQASAYRAAADLVSAQGLEAYVSLAETLPGPPALAGLRLVPHVTQALFPSVLRGAAGTDLPPPTALASLEQPVLILPWADDPGHPESTAELLATLLPNAILRPPARSPGDIAAWGPLVEEFLG